jgi:hypothetical protein
MLVFKSNLNWDHTTTHTINSAHIDHDNSDPPAAWFTPFISVSPSYIATVPSNPLEAHFTTSGGQTFSVTASQQALVEVLQNLPHGTSIFHCFFLISFLLIVL